MSPTPILDRQPPPPAPPPVYRGKWLAAGVALGLLILFLPGDLLPTDPLGPLKLFACFVPALFCGILVHELGHVAAGLIAGFEFRRVLVGPWSFTREARGYRFRFNGGRFLTGGYTMMTPRGPSDLRRQFRIFLAGGPLATLLLFLAVAPLPSGAVKTSLLLSNAILAIFSWIPLENRGHYTDARVMRVLSDPGPAGERLAAVLYLVTLDARGTPPRDWPPEVVAKLAVAGGGSTYRAAGRIFLHVYAREAAPPAQVADALEHVLAVSGEMNGGLRLAYFAEAAFFQGVTNRNAALARAWLDDARAVKGAIAQKDWDASAMAAIAFAEGNEEEFRKHRARALEYLDRQPGPSGSVAASRERLAGLSITEPVPSTHPPVA